MARQIVVMVVALLVASAILGFLEWRWPALRGRGFWQRRGHLVDLAYWFSNPLLTRAAIKVATVAAVVPIALLLGAPLGEQPSVFGVRDAVPTGFFAQLAWPFRRG